MSALAPEVWGETDCVTHALPTLDRAKWPGILQAPTVARAIAAGIREYGSLEACWGALLAAAGYRRVGGAGAEEDRVLGEDEAYGWTVGVLRSGSVWIRCPSGLVRARWVGAPTRWRLDRV